MAAISGSTRGRAVLELLDRSRGTLAQACQAQRTNDRYIAAHLGALRAAAALLAAQNGDHRPHRRRLSGNVWDGIARLAPELGEWADYFAVCGERRRALEGGTEHATGREADDLLRAAETFLGLIQACLGLPIVQTDFTLAAAVRA